LFIIENKEISEFIFFFTKNHIRSNRIFSVIFFKEITCYKRYLIFYQILKKFFITVFYLIFMKILSYIYENSILYLWKFYLIFVKILSYICENFTTVFYFIFVKILQLYSILYLWKFYNCILSYSVNSILYLYKFYNYIISDIHKVHWIL
jgi:hypothetical protein